MSKKKKLLLISDSVRVFTGFANVARHVADYLHDTDKYEIAYLCWFDAPLNNIVPKYTTYSTLRDHSRCCGRGPVVVKQEVGKQPTYLKHQQGVLLPTGDGPTCLNGPNMEHDKYAYESLHGTILDFKPDIVWGLGDTWMQFHVNMLDIRKCFTYYEYCPIDGSPMPHITNMGNMSINWIDTLNKADKAFAFCDFGRDTMIKTGALYGTDLKKVGVIYHGCDIDNYKPLQNKTELRKKWFPEIKDDVFLIGFFSRNQPRKAVHKWFEAIAFGVKKGYWTKDTLQMYGHFPWHDVGWAIPDLIKTHGLEEFFIKRNKLQVGTGPSDKDMNELYNCCDLTTLPTRGEGWSLTISEAMAAGVPVLMSAYSAHHDWAGNAAARIKIAALDSEPLTNIDRAVVDVEDYADKIKLFYDNVSYEEAIQRFPELDKSYKDEKQCQ